MDALNAPNRSSPRSQRWWLLTAVVVLIGLATALVVTQLRSDNSATRPTTTTTPTTTLVPGTGHQLLWPFADDKQVAAWQASYREGGHQPWHLDAGMTAQSFTQGYLGYQSLDQITALAIIGTDPRVGVGYKAPNGGTLTVAVSTGGHINDVERFAITGVHSDATAQG